MAPPEASENRLLPGIRYGLLDYATVAIELDAIDDHEAATIE
jgi:hypothetical protein